MGDYSPEFGLLEARAEVTANQDLLKQGIDPRTVRVRDHKRGSPPAPLVAATPLPVSASDTPTARGKHSGAGTRALSDEEIGRFLVHRFELCSTERLARDLTILLLTSVRRSELCRTQWEHIDFVNRTWLIPAEHTKSQRALLVPLTDRLLEEFRALQRLAGRSVYVLPRKKLDSPIDPPLITRSTARCMWRFKMVGIDPFTPHDLRRTCRTGLSRIGVRRFIARRVLNHKQAGVDGIYDQYQYLKQRRRALARWSNHCIQLESSTARLLIPWSSAGAANLENDPCLRRPLTHRLTRQELHQLVWSEPIRLLSKKFDISDAGLAKLCRRHHIPVPRRGYWAKRQAKLQLRQSRRSQTDQRTQYPASGEHELAAAT